MDLDIYKNRTNPVLVAQSISKLVTKIKKDVPSSTTEIKLLKDKCITADEAGISLAASRGLVLIAECGIIQTATTLSELVSSLSLVRCYAGITSAICDLLFLDLKQKLKDEGDKYECVYNLRAPQHPLISIFIRSHETCFDILVKIKYLYRTGPDQLTFYANQVLFPFYMYILCNPTTDVPDDFYVELWNFIISIQGAQSLDIRNYAIMWLQMSTEKQTIRATRVLKPLIDRCLYDEQKLVDVLILWLTSTVYELIKLDLDPREIILYLYNIIKRVKNIEPVASSMLYMLADCIVVCPSNYLEDLLLLCFSILQMGSCNKFVIHFLKASVLQWMAYASVLNNQSLVIINEMLLYIEKSDNTSNAHTRNLYSNKTCLHIKNTNGRVHTAVELNIFSESLQLSGVSEWLNRLDKVPVYILKNFFQYCIALLLYQDLEADITLKVINILLIISSEYKEMTTRLLTLFLYKLSSETDHRIHFALLKALAKMAVLRENLPLVLNTFELFSKVMFGLKSFALTLFCDLWKANEKCYIYLQNSLTAADERSLKGKTLQEFYITKAYVIKEVCLKRPEVHGQELVSHLSEILNKCRDQNGDLASALAIDAIKVLCKTGVVDINSAWNELSPQFKAEKRIVVLKSLCSFMTEVSYYEPLECSEQVVDDILKTLWQYATTSEHLEVVSASYSALACFTLEQISLHFPDNFKAILAHSQNSLGFNLISGRHWINLLLNVQEFTVDAVGDLLIKLVDAEVSGYRNTTYNVSEGQREPQNYNYLPEQSIIRALENYTRSQVGNWQKSSKQSGYIQCLRILSQEYSKPLPPVDWCFLQELVHIRESRAYCITIASHQVQLSGTARRLVENFITALSSVPQQAEDMETVYTNLKYLCNSIQPMTLRPFIEKSIKFALDVTQSGGDFKIFEKIIQHLCNTLGDEKLHEANRLMLSQVIVNTTHKLDINSLLFNEVLKSITVLPIRYIDELSSPRLWKEPSERQIKMSIQIRCYLAIKATVSPLTWLNDILDIEHLHLLDYKFFCKNLICVMETHRKSEFSSSWIMELLGNIQSTIANKFMTQQHLKFLCDVFVLSIVILSGHDLYLHTSDLLIEQPGLHLRLLPQSIAQLIKLQHWKSYTPQISEWLYHMINNILTPEDYKIAFFEALAALKHEDAFQKTSKWMTYVGINLPCSL